LDIGAAKKKRRSSHGMTGGRWNAPPATDGSIKSVQAAKKTPPQGKRRDDEDATYSGKGRTFPCPEAAIGDGRGSDFQ